MEENSLTLDVPFHEVGFRFKKIHFEYEFDEFS